jgi:hypothetical protein
MSDMGNFSEPNNRVIGFVTTPHLTYYAEDRQFPVAFDKGKWNGVWRCGSAELAEVTIRKAPAVLQMLSNFLLWLRKIPQVTEILRFA